MELDEALVAARKGDAAGFALLYRHLQPGVLRYLTVVVGRGAAEDVAADAWLEIARDVRKFRGDSDDFRRWAFTVARHRGLDWLRRESRRPSTPMADVPDGPARDDVPAAVLEHLGTAAALALIARLPRDQAEVVLLRVVGGMDVVDVARILRKRPGAVRVSTMRGLRRLAELVDAPSNAEV